MARATHGWLLPSMVWIFLRLCQKGRFPPFGFVSSEFGLCALVLLLFLTFSYNGRALFRGSAGPRSRRTTNGEYGLEETEEEKEEREDDLEERLFGAE